MTAHRLPVLVILIASIAAVGGALLFQYVGGLAPCELCLAERWPWYLSIGFGGLAALWGQRGTMPGVVAVCGLLFFAGTLLAFYHVGVEQHWFTGPTACTSGQAALDSVEAFKARLLGTQQVQCDVVQWSLFGVSLAGWNFLASLALTLFCAATLRRAIREDAA